MNLPQENPRYNFTVHTFGCKVNTYDTGLLQQRLLKAGMGSAETAPAVANKPRVHILNSCAVTAEATREAMRLARQLKAREPLATVVMTGCAAQVDGKDLDLAPGIDLVVANSHKGQLENILDRWFRGERQERVFRSNIFRKEDLEAGGGVEAGHTRAFLKIQDGCNSFCSFCVIPYARGKSRSISIRDLLARVRELSQAGAREIVLTGVHIGDYEDTDNRKLPELVAAILSETAIPRVRLSSLEPVELSQPLLDLFANPRLCAHFHMSIQAANSKVLREMKRQYGRDEVVWALREIAARVHGAFVGMDVIAGFPGESEDEFADTYQTLAELPWTRLHVFPYSERPGTRAALSTVSVAKPIRALRASRLRELSSERYARTALQQIGQVKDVLVLKHAGGEVPTGAQDAGKIQTGAQDAGKIQTGGRGVSRDYWPVQFTSTAGQQMLEPGTEVRVRIIGYDHRESSRMDGWLVGQPLAGLDEDATHG